MIGHWGVGTSGDDDPVLDEASHREHEIGSMAAVVRDVAVSELPQERGLRDREDPQLADAILKVRGQHGTVLDPVTQSFPGRRRNRARDSGESALDGAIADSVGGYLPPAAMSTEE